MPVNRIELQNLFWLTKICVTSCQTSNVWGPNMSCLIPIRSCFFYDVSTLRCNLRYLRAFVAVDGKDQNGLRLEKIGQVLEVCLEKFHPHPPPPKKKKNSFCFAFPKLNLLSSSQFYRNIFLYECRNSRTPIKRPPSGEWKVAA